MDNASKAIIIAAGFFIAVLVISLFMYLLTNFRYFQGESDAAKERIEANAFNSMFFDYIYAKSGDTGNTIRGYQLYDLLGLVAEMNSKPDSVYYVNVNGVSLDTNTFRDRFFYFTETLDDIYSISKVEYSNGAISNITVVDKNGNAINL